VDYFKEFIEARYEVPVVIGTHPIPEHYAQVHQRLLSRDEVLEKGVLMATPQLREAYE
jgi:hypothetical protein